MGIIVTYLVEHLRRVFERSPCNERLPQRDAHSSGVGVDACGDGRVGLGHGSLGSALAELRQTAPVFYTRRGIERKSRELKLSYESIHVAT